MEKVANSLLIICPLCGSVAAPAYATRKIEYVADLVPAFEHLIGAKRFIVYVCRHGHRILSYET